MKRYWWGNYISQKRFPAFPCPKCNQGVLGYEAEDLKIMELSWWRGTPGYSCSVALALASEQAMAIFGMTGLVLGILGIILGGAKHRMTATGLGLLVFGLLGVSLLMEPVSRACG